MGVETTVWNVLQTLKENSTDKDTQVSAIVTDSAGVIVVGGTNCHTRNMAPTEETSTRPEKYDWIEHAERNAIYDAAHAGVALAGKTMYTEGFPCVECARAIVQSGIGTLYHGSTEGFDPSKYKFDKARAILETGGVALKDWSDFLEKINTPPEDVS